MLRLSPWVSGGTVFWAVVESWRPHSLQGHRDRWGVSSHLASEWEWLVSVTLGCPQRYSGVPAGTGGGWEVVVARFSQ